MITGEKRMFELCWWRVSTIEDRLVAGFRRMVAGCLIHASDECLPLTADRGLSVIDIVGHLSYVMGRRLPGVASYKYD